MNILLSVIYGTSFGEELVLNLITGVKDGIKLSTPYRMRTVNGREWTCNLKVDLRKGTYVDYYYSVVRGEDNVVRSEWRNEPHRLELNTLRGDTITVYDHWIDLPDDSYLYSSAFTDCIRRRKILPVALSDYPVTVRLKVRAPQLSDKQRLAVTGNEDVLGGWDVFKAIPMVEHNYNEWIVDIDVTKLKSNIIYFKFLAVDVHDRADVLWEDCMNRRVELPDMKEGDVIVYELDEAFFPIYDLRCAGTQVPLFSLRSRSSFGVGDFGDLKKMIDWVALTQQRVLQLLPVNDTTTTHTWTDSYPYSSISIFALHPQYADLNALPAIEDEAERARFEALRQELNALPQVDYERVNNAKTEYLNILYRQEGGKVLASAGFKKFFDEAKSWLVPYAQYCYLREKYGTAEFSKWPDHHNFDEAERAALSDQRNAAFKQVAFYYYVQYVLDMQMSDAHRYARLKGVVLKGDIPIGVNRNGCDVWQEPRYFNLNGQAGAPPDDFSVNGQNWGLPTYNWDEMMKDGCEWWIRRFANMARFFDAYRIDHVLGFFRIWEEAYGLHFQEELFTEPFITDWVLERMFGERAAMVRETYLEPSHDGRYRMKEQYDTQRKVEAAFAGKTDKADTDQRDGLYALISDVLFVRDHKDANKFHPRISVQFDFVYESLYDSDKYLFNKIYNDYFYRRNNQFWYREAMNKLPKIIDATRMLVCAEDLGMVPDCVQWVMNELKILSLEMQSMPKDPNVRFGVLSRNPYRSVCTISSHDTATLRQWWDEDARRTQDYFNNVLMKYGAAPHPLPGWLARDIISRHLLCPSMLCILSLQDWLSIDESLRLADKDAERINVPSNPRHYWRYRMHLDLEDLIDRHDFNQNVTDLIKESGRR